MVLGVMTLLRFFVKDVFHYNYSLAFLFAHLLFYFPIAPVLL